MSSQLNLPQLAEAAAKEAIEKQLRDWGFASWHEPAWSHYGANAVGSVLIVMELDWNNLENAFKEKMKPEKQLDTGFMNESVALRINDILHMRVLIGSPSTSLEQKLEAGEKMKEDFPALCDAIGLKSEREIEETLQLALFRVGVRAAVRKLGNYGKNITLGNGPK